MPSKGGLSTPTIVCIAFIVLVVIVVGIGIACFSCSSSSESDSKWSDGIVRYFGGKGPARGPRPNRPPVRPPVKAGPGAPAGARAAGAPAGARAISAAGAKAAGPAGPAGAKAAGPAATRTARAAGARAGVKTALAGGARAAAPASAKKAFLQSQPAAPAGSRLLSQRVAAVGDAGGRSGRSERLASAIQEAKHPKKKSLSARATRASLAKVTGTAASDAGTGYKGVQTGGVQMGSIGATGAGRLAHTETAESRAAIMKQGRGSRLTKEQIKGGILQAHKRGRDPSRAARLMSTRTTAVNQEAWRAPANPKTKRTYTIPCGASPTLEFYDAMKASQLAEAAAAR